MKNKKWFTLVELIVVVTILAILGTIWFLSFQWFSRDARDSVRLSDIRVLKNVLSLYHIKNLYYPEPTNPVQITYSWATIWTQWTFWEDTRKSMSSRQNISKIPKDPLTKNEYTYSLLKTWNEYQIWAIKEWWWLILWYNNKLFNKVQAISKLKAITRWNYNGKILKTKIWSVDYILALPSIIATDTSNTDIQYILDNKKLVYNNYNNLPNSYTGSQYEINWWFDYTNTNPLIYSWNIQNLKNENELLKFADNLKKAYVWTILENKKDFKKIVDIDTTNKNISSKNIIITYINNNIWGLPEVKGLEIDNSCSGENVTSAWCFSVLDIPWLILWYDFADNSTITLDSSDTIKKVLNKWPIKSDIELLSGNPKQWTIDWKKTLRLTKDLLTAPDSFSWSTDEFHFFYISRENSRSTNFMINFNWTSINCWWESSSNRVSVHTPWSNGIWYIDLGWCDWSSRIELWASKPVWSISMISAFSSRKNNQRWFYLDWWENWKSIINSSVRLYTQWWLRIWEEAVDTEILEFFAFDKILTSDEQQQLEGYMACKWGIQSNLPTLHPYKNVCPN